MQIKSPAVFPRGFFAFPFIPRRVQLSAIALYALP